MSDTTFDARYSVRQEATGRMQSHWVARFAGEWIGAHVSQIGAREIANEHSTRRQASYQVPMRSYRWWRLFWQWLRRSPSTRAVECRCVTCRP